jgi:LuxR family maltose regulon positive regulatory protein
MLGVYYAMALLMGGYPLGLIESRLQDMAGADPNAAAPALKEDEPASPVHAGMTVVQALVAAYQGRSGESAELSQRALELLPPESLFLRSLVIGILGLAHLYGDDFQVATRVLQEAVRVSQQAGNVMNAVLAQCHLAELAMMKGQFRRAKALYEQALSLGVDKEGRPIPVAGVAHTGLGQLFLEWNDLESARSHLERGIALTRGWGEAGTITGYGTLARVSQATGDCEGAHELLDKAEQIAIRFDAMDVDDIGVALRKADLSLAEGGLQEALNWSEQRGLKRDPRTVAMDLTDAGPSFTRRYVRLAEYIVFAKLLTALGRSQPKGARESFQEAEALLAALLDWAESEGRAAMQVQIQVLRAMTLREMGKTDLALRHLESALTLAEPEGYVRCFVQEGQPMAELLGLAVSQGISTAYVRQLLSSPESHGTFDPNSRFAGQADPTIQEQPLIDPLSDRELEVLRLLPSSLSSTEIAEQLFISVNTVRSHIRSIYGKLDVHSRHEAIARAQELNLI